MKKKKEEERTFLLLKQWILIAPFMQKTFGYQKNAFSRASAVFSFFGLKKF